MSRKRGSDAPYAAFGKLLTQHMGAPTRHDRKNRNRWLYKELAGKITVSGGKGHPVPTTIGNWRSGRTLPSPNQFNEILNAFFGPLGSADEPPARVAFREAYDHARLLQDKAKLEAAPREPDAVDYEPSGARLGPVPAVAGDASAADDPAFVRRHAAVIQRLTDLLKIIGDKLDTQPAWQPLRKAACRALKAARALTVELRANLIDLYDNTVSLGTFVALDDALGADPAASDPTLDHTIRRALVDYLTVAAPWLRTFPSALQWDSARDDFLARRELFVPVRASLDAAQGFLNAAVATKALSPEDAARVALPLESATRPGALAEKAAWRGVSNAQQLLVRSAALTAPYLSGAVEPGLRWQPTSARCWRRASRTHRRSREAFRTTSGLPSPT